MLKFLIFFILIAVTLKARVPTQIEKDLRSIGMHSNAKFEHILEKINDRAFELQRSFFAAQDTDAVMTEYNELFKLKSRVIEYYTMVGKFSFEDYSSAIFNGPKFDYTANKYLEITWYYLQPKLRAAFVIEYDTFGEDFSSRRPSMTNRNGVYPGYNMIENQFLKLYDKLDDHLQIDIARLLIEAQMTSKIVLDNEWIERLSNITDPDRLEFLYQASLTLLERRTWLKDHNTRLQDLFLTEVHRIFLITEKTSDETIERVGSYIKRIPKYSSSFMEFPWIDQYYEYAFKYLPVKEQEFPSDSIHLKMQRIASQLKTNDFKVFFTLKFFPLAYNSKLDDISDTLEFFMRKSARELNALDYTVSPGHAALDDLGKEFDKFVKDILNIAKIDAVNMHELNQEINLLSKDKRASILETLNISSEKTDCIDLVESLI